MASNNKLSSSKVNEAGGPLNDSLLPAAVCFGCGGASEAFFPAATLAMTPANNPRLGFGFTLGVVAPDDSDPTTLFEDEDVVVVAGWTIGLISRFGGGVGLAGFGGWKGRGGDGFAVFCWEELAGLEAGGGNFGGLNVGVVVFGGTIS